MKKRIVFLGPPASGKGTQVHLVANHFSWPMLSIGDLIRDEIQNKSDLGHKIKRYVLKGDLVPDEMIITLFRKHAMTVHYQNGFVMDGYPRTLKQAEAYDALFSNQAETAFFF